MQELIEVTGFTDHLLCDNNNKVKLLCCSQNCNKCALLCRKEDCNCLPREHSKCEFLFAQNLIREVQDKKGAMSPQIQKAIQKVDEVYVQAIQRLSLYREGLQLWRQNFGLSSQESQFLALIAANRRELIKGELIYQIKNQIDNKAEYSFLNQSWVDSFWKEGKLQFQKLFNKVNRFHRQFFTTQKPSAKNLDSLIVQESYTLHQMFDRPISEFKLLYRASENKFSVKKFHENCDNIPDTVTLIKTEFQNIIGGYTPATWESLANGQSKADNTGQSFIFSLTLGEKYKVIDNQKAIRNYQSYGPAFGVQYNKYDLCIVDEADRNNCLFNFPYGYNNGQYMNSQKSYTAFVGAASGNTAKVKQWEVFHILWK